MTDDELLQHCYDHHALSVGAKAKVKLDEDMTALRTLHDTMHNRGMVRLHMHGEDGSLIDFAS